ncbi:hypothetical protein PsYK624_054760 [Phanerochaete sordida]|uniref:Protein kinase domain-containing protein n=1 Tax=Phanerochaete sordida TaxID=48140 RepID=A0A9P3G6V4_9APHY|nr:hypothetical protein PsYK624_054760 [Phanerochaete sordida]
MAPKSLPPYLSPGSTLTFRHEQHGELCATVLPFAASTLSTYPVILVQLRSIATSCALRPGANLIVKIFDPRFNRSSFAPWYGATEAAAARIHGGQLVFDPKERPSLFDTDPEDEPLPYEVQLFKFTTWLARNELLAYQHLARVQGSLVPICYGGGVLDLSGTGPRRAIAPPVVFLEHVRDAVSLDRFDARRLTQPLLRAIMDTGDALNAHGVIHTDANEANFLLIPARNPTRVMVLDFAEAWTRDAAENEEDWEGGKREWDVRHQRKVVLNRKFREAGLPVPDMLALPRLK